MTTLPPHTSFSCQRFVHRALLFTLVFSAACASRMPAGPRLSADGLECGNLGEWRVRDDRTIEFTIRPDTNAPREWRWFHFRVEGAKGERLEFEIPNARQASASMAWPYSKPVVSGDGGRTWTRIEETDYDGQVYRFAFVPQSDADLVATLQVYGLSRVAEKIGQWKRHPRAAACDVIARSVQGREIQRLVIVNPAPKERPVVWVIARQHPSETSGSWKCEGFVEWLLSEEPDAVAFADAFETHVVPCMNPDGVVLGNYRRNAEGLNLNRVWNNPDPARAPEVAMVREAIRAHHAAGRKIAFFADFHSFSSIRANFFLYNDLFSRGGDNAAEIESTMRILQKINPDFSMDRSDGAGGGETGIAKDWACIELGVPAVTFESAYQDVTYGPNKGQYMTIERYKALGRDFGIALKRRLIDGDEEGQ